MNRLIGQREIFSNLLAQPEDKALGFMDLLREVLMFRSKQSSAVQRVPEKALVMAGVSHRDAGRREGTGGVWWWLGGVGYFLKCRCEISQKSYVPHPVLLQRLLHSRLIKLCVTSWQGVAGRLAQSSSSSS